MAQVASNPDAGMSPSQVFGGSTQTKTSPNPNIPAPSPSLTGGNVQAGGQVDGQKAYNTYALNPDAANNPYLAQNTADIKQQMANVQGQNAAQASASLAGPVSAQQGFNAQAQNLAQLQAQSQGQGPAAQAVQMQSQNATNQGINAQMAMAGSMRGGNAGEALRQASVGQAQVTGQAANQAATNTLNSEQQGINNAGAVAGAMQGEEQQNQQFNAGAQNQIGLANSAQSQQQQQFSDSLQQQYLGQQETLDSAQAAATLQAGEFGVNSAATQTAGAASNGVANTNATTAQITGVGGLVNSGVQTLENTSDRRAKTNVDDGDEKSSDFLDHLSAKEWDYKDPEKHGEGRHLGVMAQDLQKSALGDQMVSPDHEGTLRVDYGKGMAAIVASLAYLNDKMKALEGKGS